MCGLLQGGGAQLCEALVNCMEDFDSPVNQRHAVFISFKIVFRDREGSEFYF